MGRRVERGALTLTLLQALLPPGASRVHMEALLEIADSLLTYRARYLSSLQVAPVVDLLLTDDTNPRSLAFQVAALMEHLKRLPDRSAVVRTSAERRLIALQSTLLTADIEQVCAGDGSGLKALLDESVEMMWQFSDDVGHTWFAHMSSSRALSPPAWVNEDLEAEMSMFRVRHATRYAYEAPVIHAHHACHLRPRQFDWQGVAKHEIEVARPRR